MRILIVKLSSLGDLVHALPAISLIRRFIPEASIDWLCYKNYADLPKSISAINRVIEIPNKKFSSLVETANIISAEKYDYLIDFQGLIKTAALSFFSGAKIFGMQNPREKLASLFYNYKFSAPATLKNKKHIVSQNLDLAKFFIEKISNQQISIDESLIEFYGSDASIMVSKSHEPYKKVCIIPSTTWESKLWLAESWVQLINFLHEKYKSQIFILGTMADMRNIEPIISKLRVPFHLVTSKKLTELPDFFIEMDLVVGLDTGPLHIAAATLYPLKKLLNKKIIGIYGPSSGARTGPFGFEYISYDELHSQPASNKKSAKDDGFTMQKLSPDLIIRMI